MKKKMNIKHFRPSEQNRSGIILNRDVRQGNVKKIKHQTKNSRSRMK